MAGEPTPITRAEYAALYGGAVANEPTPITRAEYAAMYGDQQSPGEAAGRAFTGGMQNILNGLTLGFGDEGVAGANALIDRAQGVPLSAAYDQRLADTRAMRNEFRQAAGGPLAIASDVGSSLLMPIKKELFSAHPKKMAALLGGLYGFGESEGTPEDRALGAAGGSVVGAGSTALLQALGAGAKAVLQSDLGLKVRDAASKAKEYLSKTLLSPELGQAGKVTVTGGDAVPALAPDLTPTQVQLLQRAREISPAQMAKAASTLDAAISEQVPMTLVEALANEGTTRQARFLANYEPTMGKVGDFIEQRSAAAPGRISTIADAIAPSKPSFQGGTSLRQGAEKVDRALRAERRAITNPIYEEAFRQKPILTSPEVERLLSHPDIVPSVKDAQRVIAIRKGVGVDEVPANSIEVANEVLAELSSRGKAAKWQVGDKASYNLAEAKDALESAIYKEAPGLKVARDAYGVISKQLKEQVGADAVSMLKNLEIGQMEGAGEKLMSMPAEMLVKVKKAFETQGAEQNLRDGIRAYFTQIIEKQSGGFSNNRNIVSKLLGNTQTVNRLKAVLGADEADKIIKQLAREETLFKGAQSLNPQSGTAGNLAEANAFEAQPGMTGAILKALMSPRATAQKAIDKFLMRPANEQLAQDMAETYITNPRQGLADLRSILPIQEQRYPYINQTNELVKALIRGGGRSAATISGQLGSTK